MNIHDWPQLSEKLLNSLGYSWKKRPALREAILRLSDHYQSEEKTTPWHERWAQAAYLSYFLPLNYVRLQSVFDEVTALNLWPDQAELIDFGAGPGVGALAMPKMKLSRYMAVDAHPNTEKIFNSLEQKIDFSVNWIGQVSEDFSGENTMALFSYSLNELTELPDWIDRCQTVIIVEPSTHQAGRRLLELREKMIAKGFFVWAPCLHQMQCPLLHQTQRDWCHHRIHWQKPEWFQELDKHLPMKNDTLTYSYLLLSKEAPEGYPNNVFRVTGDLLSEKGKYKIMACRGEKREFISWLKKEKHSPKIARGQIVECRKWDETQSEIRPGENYQILRSLARELGL